MKLVVYTSLQSAENLCRYNEMYGMLQVDRETFRTF